MNKKLIAGISAAVVVGVLCAAEFGGAYYFHNHYAPNTTINGVNVSGKSMDSARQALDDSLKSYTLTIRGEDTEDQLSASDVDFISENSTSHSARAFISVEKTPILQPRDFKWLSRAHRCTGSIFFVVFGISMRF